MAPDQTKGQQASSDVAALLRARNSLIWVVTREEARAERGLIDACAAAQYAPLFWDCANGVTGPTGEPTGPGADAADPGTALAAIRDSRERQVWILRDLTHRWIDDPTIRRSLRSLARTLPASPRAEARAIVVLTPVSEIPPELQGHAIVIDWPLPDRAEVAGILDAVLAALPEDVRATAAPNGTRDAAIDAAVGLTAEEAQSCYAKSLVATRKIDPPVVAREKKRTLAAIPGVECIDPIAGGLDAVGGYEGVKAWLATRRSAFTPEARAYGLPAPKGLIVVGPPGCGKSLLVKALASGWGLPLIKIDLGAMKSKWVGDSEGNLRRAEKAVDAIGRCIVWVDEVEKAFGGATQGAADGGVSSDALGSFLTWAQDRKGGGFIVATANDVSKLPPELLRKGRFDEIFALDLPNASERAAILAAALREYRRTETPDLAAVAAATADFTGSEIAALVCDALYVAFSDGARPLATEDLIAAARATVPLSRTAPEKITGVREWAKGRARPATLQDSPATGAVSAGRALDL